MTWTATSVLEDLPDAVLVLGPDGAVRLANARARALGDLAGLRATLLAACQAGGILGVAPEAADTEWQDGESLWRWRGQAAAGSGWVFVGRQRDEAAREAAERARAGVFASITHELRTPLNAIMGFGELLQASQLSPQQRAQVSRMTEAGAHLLGVIDQILDFARLDAGRHDLEAGEADLVALSEGVLELLGPQARRKGLRLALSAPPGPLVWHGDAGRLRQVLVNLAGNAIKFTRTGGVLVRWAPVQSPGAGGWRLEVDDTGPGIPPDRRKAVFDAFELARPMDARAHGGTGLGLAVVARLVAAFGGSCGATASCWNGARFWVELPGPAQAPAARRLSAGNRPGVCWHGDDPVTRLATAETLAWQGITLHDRSSPTGENPTVHLLAGPPAGGWGGADAIALVDEGDEAAKAAWAGHGVTRWLSRPVRQARLIALCDGVLPEAALRDGAVAPAAHQGLSRDDAPHTPAPAGPCVLVADDNPVNLMLARAQVQRLGLRAVTASDGSEVAALALAHAPAAALLDLRMPVMDGADAARALRAAGFTGGIIALTAEDGTDHDSASGLFDAWLRKPVDSATLARVLGRWTDMPNGPMQTAGSGEPS